MVAPAGIASIAVERASVTAMPSLAAALPESADRQNTSGVSSDVWLPHAPTVPTTGAGVPEPQSYPSVLPMRTKSPAWLAW